MVAMATAATISEHAGPAQAARRRANSASGVQAVRQKLVHGACIEPEFEHELMLMFVRNELSAQATILFLAAIFSLASMFWAPWTQAVLWLILVIGTKVLLLELCRRFQSTPVAEINLPVWRRRLILAEATSGMAWAGFALVGIESGPTLSHDYVFSSHVFVFASLIVVLAIRMTFASTVLQILYVGTIPMTLAVIARLMLVGDYFYLALATMAIGVHVYFVFLAKGLNSTALAMLQFRAQKDALIAELEEAKSMSDQARRHAEDANVAKSRFLATMSHELRNPAQCHPRLLRGHEGGDHGADGEPSLQGIRRQHPPVRQPPAAPHQRDPRPVADRGWPLRSQRGAGAPDRCDG
jgi:two-component system cell cycle sensor histidine kinase PleC